MQKDTKWDWRNAICEGFFLDYKTPKITTMDKTCDSDWFVSLLCIETKIRGSLRETISWH